MAIRTGLLAIVAATIAIAAPAAAQDDGYGYRFHENGDSGLSGFAGLRGSLAFTSSDIHGSVNNAGTVSPVSASLDTGGGGSLYFGTRLPFGLRLELEGLYKYLPINQVSLAGVPAVGTGQVQIGASMVNMMWDLPVPDFPFRPFIGAGVGAAHSDVSAKTVGFRPISGSNWSLAYNFMGGIELPLSQSSRFNAMYRWYRIDDLKLNCSDGTVTSRCNSDLTTQSLDFGIEMDM